jgi:hypothetical protein
MELRTKASNSASLLISIGSPGGRIFGAALAATEGLSQSLVDQPITLTALRAGQQQTAVIEFNDAHDVEKVSRKGELKRAGAVMGVSSSCIQAA